MEIKAIEAPSKANVQQRKQMPNTRIPKNKKNEQTGRGEGEGKQKQEKARATKFKNGANEQLSERMNNER